MFSREFISPTKWNYLLKLPRLGNYFHMGRILGQVIGLS